MNTEIPETRRQGSESVPADRKICGPNERRFPLWVIALALLLLSACRQAPQTVQAAPDDWREFQGIWTAAGNRNSIQFSDKRYSSIARFEGSLVLSRSSLQGVGLGFRSEAIIFNDSATGLVGRAVSTDEKGNQAFSELRAENNGEKNLITGTFVGGTGRYAGITGGYTFSWKFLIQGEDEAVQGQSVGLSGRARLAPQQSSTNPGGGPRA